VKRNGGTLASNLDANDFEITRGVNPATDGSAVSKKWVGDRYLQKTGGLVEGDLNMGDSSDFTNLRDPTNAKNAVNKQWVENNFLKPSSGLVQATADNRYVRKIHHIYSQCIWGYRGVSVASTRYYAYCKDQIPPSWRTDTINNLTNINLESITIKSDSPLLSIITKVPLELILWATV
jgi:hypothetical protein